MYVSPCLCQARPANARLHMPNMLIDDDRFVNSPSRILRCLLQKGPKATVPPGAIAAERGRYLAIPGRNGNAA